MKVAPFDSCIVCFKGDVATMVGFEGEANWLIAGLGGLGVPHDQARQIVLQHAVDEYGCDLGYAPPKMQATFRVCSDCATKASMSVGYTIKQP